MIKAVRVLGWFNFILGGLLAFIGIISRFTIEDPFGIGSIIFFILLALFGFLLTKYKGQIKIEPRPDIKQNNHKPTSRKKPLKDKKSAPAPDPEVVEFTRKELGIPQGQIFTIAYEDFNGNVTYRDIEVLKVYEKGDKIYIHAFCHLRLEVRLFLTSRIISMESDNQQIKNINEFLLKDYTPPTDISHLNLEEPD